MDPELAIRRERLPDPEDAGEDDELAERIREEIRDTGPITFARFMERALYEPGRGYYRRPEAGPGGSRGDFLTAPEAHPIFGAVIGRLVEQAWEEIGRPSPFTVSEPGAGNGALAAGLLGGLRDLGSPLLDAIRYRPIEVEAARLTAFRERITAAGFGAQLVLDDAPGDPVETGAVVANEVLDALPVHRVVGRPGLPGGIAELGVGIGSGGGFEAVELPAPTPGLGARLADEGIALREGQVTEICLGLDSWLAGATRHLARGVVVLVDYAAEPDALHDPVARPTGTVRAFAGHAVSGDPFAHVGRQDLTATVDLAAVRAAARRAGLRPVGETTQAELLAALGTGDLTRAYLGRAGASLQDALDLRSALARLLDPRGMGGFRVMVFGRGMAGAPPLAGLRRLRADA